MIDATMSLLLLTPDYILSLELYKLTSPGPTWMKIIFITITLFNLARLLMCKALIHIEHVMVKLGT